MALRPWGELFGGHVQVALSPRGTPADDEEGLRSCGHGSAGGSAVPDRRCATREGSSMSAERIVKVRVTLKGRPVRTYVFNKDIVSVGRNPEADIFLDNPGISRDHMQIVATPYGTYRVEDLNSANGTFVNDVLANNQTLQDN